MAHRATLVEVARHAGVSLGSASRALHGSGASERMVRRVKAAAADLGYRPHVAGRSLRTKRTFQVAFAVADIGNPVYVEMLTEIHRVLAPHGYRVVVMSTGNSTRSTCELLGSLDDSLIDGLIISPLRIDTEFIELATTSPVPVVTIGRPLDDHGIDTVSTDSGEGIRLAVEHLLASERRRLLFLNGPLDTTPGNARQRGYESISSEIEARGENLGTVVAADFTVVAGARAIERHLATAQAHDQLIEGIVAANDLLAIGAIHALREHGVRVPADVAVVGMDDTELGRVFQPTLTSVSLGATRRGNLAAELILRRVEHRQEAASHLHVGPELIVRQSTSPARQSEPGSELHNS